MHVLHYVVLKKQRLLSFDSHVAIFKVSNLDLFCKWNLQHQATFMSQA